MQPLTDLTIFQYSEPLVLDHLSRSLLGGLYKENTVVYCQRGARVVVVAFLSTLELNRSSFTNKTIVNDTP